MPRGGPLRRMAWVIGRGVPGGAFPLGPTVTATRGVVRLAESVPTGEGVVPTVEAGGTDPGSVESTAATDPTVASVGRVASGRAEPARTAGVAGGEDTYRRGRTEACAPPCPPRRTGRPLGRVCYLRVGHADGNPDPHRQLDRRPDADGRPADRHPRVDGARRDGDAARPARGVAVRGPVGARRRRERDRVVPRGRCRHGRLPPAVGRTGRPPGGGDVHRCRARPRGRVRGVDALQTPRRGVVQTLPMGGAGGVSARRPRPEPARSTSASARTARRAASRSRAARTGGRSVRSGAARTP